MSLDVKNIHLNTLNIDEIGNDLALNSTHKLTLSSLAGINTNSKLILGNHTMSNLNSLNSQNNNSLFLEAFGTRSIILNHTTSTTNEVEIKSDGKTYFNSLPTITSTPSGDNQILSGRNFDLDYTSSFSPKVFAWNGLSASTAVDFARSTQTGFYIIVGKIVCFQTTVVYTSKNSANAAWNVYLSLPETIVNASIPQSLFIGYINNLIGGVGIMMCYL